MKSLAAAMLIVALLAVPAQATPTGCVAGFYVQDAPWFTGAVTVDVLQEAQVRQTATYTQAEVEDGDPFELALESPVVRGVETTLRLTGDGHSGAVARILPATGQCAVFFGTLATTNGAPAVTVEFADLPQLAGEDAVAVVTSLDPEGDDVATPDLQWSRVRAGSEQVMSGQTGATFPAALIADGDVLKLSVDVQDTFGARTVDVASVQVAPTAAFPLASFSVGPTTAIAGKFLSGDLTFDATASQDGPEAPVTPAADLLYRWDLDDDGTFETGGTSAARQVTAEFSGGQHTVTLQVEDALGLQSQTESTFWVNRLPSADAAIAAVTRDIAPVATIELADADNDDASPDDVLGYDFAWSTSNLGCAGPFTAGPTGSDTALEQTLPLTSIPVRGGCVRLALTPSDRLQDGPAAVATVVVGDAVPAIGLVSLSPASPGTEDDLTLDFLASDADGDVLDCEVTWFINGTEQPDLALVVAGCQDASTVTIPASLTGHAEAWTASVRASDASTQGAAVVSNVVAIGNTVPTILDLELGPLEPGTADDLEAIATIDDADVGQAVTCTFQWLLGGVVVATQTDVACDGGVLSDDLTSRGQAWTVRAVATDAAGTTSGALEADVTIVNSAPTASAGADRVVAGGSIVTLTGSATDPDTDTLTTGWAFVSGTALTLAGDGPGAARFTAPLSGSAVLKFTASDGTAPAASDQVTLAFDADNDDDGVGNAADLCVMVPDSGQQDLDGDGLGDACDATPDGHDNDNDGHRSVGDNCPDTLNQDQRNADGDAHGDACDGDDDGDGVADGSDAFPADATESADRDGDGLGDNADLDDDGDGRIDTDDNCPLHANLAQADQDGDGLGNDCDGDRDGDGKADAADAFPLDPSEHADADGDGVGDMADLDDDNDRVPDADEAGQGTDPNDPGSSALAPTHLQAVPDGAGGAYVVFAPVADARVTEYLVFREASPIVLQARLPAGSPVYVHHDADAPETSFRYYVQSRLLGEGLGYLAAPRSNNVTAAGPVLDCDGSPDPDSDGLCTRMELSWGLDPAKSDTDGDGRSDGDEALARGGAFTLAWLADSDADGRQDPDEVRRGSDALGLRGASSSRVAQGSWALLGFVVLFSIGATLAVVWARRR